MRKSYSKAEIPRVLKKSLSLTFGFVASVVVVFAALTAPDSPQGVPATDRALPSEIVAAEDDYTNQQQRIEQNLRLLTLSTLDRLPEDRRDLMLGWMEENRALLEEQVRRSDSLDALYERHGIKSETDLLEMMEKERPGTEEEAASPTGRRWALERDLAQIRQVHEGDPEKLRDAMYTWHEANREALRAVDAEVRDELRRQSESSIPSWPGAPEPVAILPSSEAPEDMKGLFEKMNSLGDAQDLNPPPLSLSTTASFEEMDAWRERFGRVTAGLTVEMNELNHQMTDKTASRIASENPYELVH